MGRRVPDGGQSAQEQTEERAIKNPLEEDANPDPTCVSYKYKRHEKCQEGRDKQEKPENDFS